MKWEVRSNLLDKYYKGETSAEEEKELKNSILSEETNLSGKDIFGYFENENKVPENLEEIIFSGFEKKLSKRKTLKMRIYGISSIAAVLAVLISVYINTKLKNEKLENEFFVMEQALYQVSKSIQPEEQKDMFILWVDNDVEIIIN